MTTLDSINPTTGEIIQKLERTPVNALPEIFLRARAAQAKWAAIPVKKRMIHLHSLRETLIHRVEDVADIISRENGKPRFEAMINELLPAVDMTRYVSKHAARWARSRDVPLTLMKHRRSTLHYWPYGVVAIISPWNYPFLLPFGEIVMALAAGNAVVFKPSEITPLVGLRLQEVFDEAGFPQDVLQTVIGDGELGAAIVKQRPDKIFFTGSVPTGRKIMAAAAETLTPVNLELGGKDAMIVLADADLDYATSAALWGGFSNSGQVCASTERILVHESIAEHFVDLLKAKAAQLRQGPSAAGNNDLGAITFNKQKDVYERHLTQARQNGAQISGGEFSADRRFLKPTIVTGPQIESLDVYNEETFGPVVAVTTFKSPAEAVRKANASRYGLLAAVITRNPSLGEQIARQLEVGTVTINEVTYTAGLGETPWGGIKESGIGRSHSEIGFHEFLQIRHIHKPRSRLFVFKSPWWFPYTPYQMATFRLLFNLYSRSWVEKIKAFPIFLWNLVQFLKNERRL